METPSWHTSVSADELHRGPHPSRRACALSQHEHGGVPLDHELVAVRAREGGAVADDVAAHARQRRLILRGHLHRRRRGG